MYINTNYFSYVLILFDELSMSKNNYILTHIFRLSLSYNTKQQHIYNTFSVDSQRCQL